MKDPQSTSYRLNLCNPEVARAYGEWKQRRGIPGHIPPSDREREEFEREWMAAYLAACRREEGEDGCRRLYAFGPVALTARFGDDGQALYQVEDKRAGGEPAVFAQPLEAWANFVDRLAADADGPAWGHCLEGKERTSHDRRSVSAAALPGRVAAAPGRQ